MDWCVYVFTVGVIVTTAGGITGLGLGLGLGHGGPHHYGVTSFDGTPLPTVPFAPIYGVRFQKDRAYLEQQLAGKRLVLQWWDRATGDAQVCWEDDPTTCGQMKGMYLYCLNWNQTGVPDNIPKLGYPGQDAFIPNGTVIIPPPGSTKSIKGKWLAPIAGDCRYWEENWRFPNLTLADVDPMAMKQAFESNDWLPSTKAIPNLALGRPIHRRDESRDLVADHFAALHDHRSDKALNAYAYQGAAMLQSHIRSNGSVGTHQAVTRAVIAMLDAHHEHNAWGKWLTRRSPKPARDVLDAFTKALDETSNGPDKQAMRSYLAGGMVEAVAQRALDGKTTGKADHQAMDSAFDIVFAEDLHKEVSELHARSSVEWR